MIKVKFPLSPLGSKHAIRGVGRYTAQLQQALLKAGGVEIVPANSKVKPDIIHYPTLDFFRRSLPFVSFTKTVVTVHDTIPLVFPDKYRPGKRGTFNFFYQKLALKSISAIITDSDHSKSDIQQYLDVNKNKLYVVPLAAAEELFSPNERQIGSMRRKLGLPSKYILYVGDINYNKNIPQLIKTLKYLPWNIKLVCVGKNFVKQDISEWRAIETQIALSDVAKRVIFINNVLTDDFTMLACIYAGALCYIQPSLYEGFGLPVLEAMKCGTPVVSTKISSLSEITGNKYAFFAEPTAESLVQAINQVLRLDYKSRTTWLQAASAWSQRFTWAKTAHGTLAIYQRVLGN